MTSLQAFGKESISAVIQVPDYQLRLKLSLQQGEPLVVEAFVAFEEMFYLQLRWKAGGTYPEVMLSSQGSRYHKLLLDLTVQSPQYLSAVSEATQPVPCTWSPRTRPIEVHRPSSLMTLDADRPPTFHNDVHISLDETVCFTLVGTIWELDDTRLHSLQCASFRSRSPKDFTVGPPDLPGKMLANVAAIWAASTSGSPEIPPDIQLVPDADQPEEEKGSDSEGSGEDGLHGSRSRKRGTARGAHAFLLQAQSQVFRRMLAAPMVEATERTVRMSGVSPAELDDLLSAVYGFGVPADVLEDDSRLLALLALADRYALVPLRDECAALLECRVSEANMAAILQVADLHHAEALKATVLAFIAARMERITEVMDTDDRAVRRALREYIAACESNHRKHAIAGDTKATEVTLTV